MRYIKRFDEISIADVASVGGKNASIGSMIQQLSKQGIRVPHGFALTADAYWYFIDSNNLLEPIKARMAKITNFKDKKNSLPYEALAKYGAEIRLLIEKGIMPEDLALEITQAYQALSKVYNTRDIDVAVRSSATAEDLPTASFAGQHETFLNVRGIERVLLHCKKCIASLFTDRAIIYRIEKGFDHFKIALSVGVQKMVRSDKASAGVLFTIDTETGFANAIIINGSWGLGEAVVKGVVNPDEFWVHKQTLEQGFKPILKKHCGQKKKKIVFAKQGKLSKEVAVPKKEQQIFCLTDEEILELARYALTIEKFYSKIRNEWSPQDIEWAKDGIDGKLYIVQARPETIHAQKERQFFEQFAIALPTEELQNKILLTGISIGQAIATGKARVAQSIKDIKNFNKGDILIAPMTDPDWVPIMKHAAAIVTNSGGRTSHAAIVSRELGIPAVIGTQTATSTIKQGQPITIDCSRGQTGYVYDGQIPFKKETINVARLSKPKSTIMVNCAEPDRAIMLSFLPVEGVGLARTEFIISNQIKMHPMAAIEPHKITNKRIIKEIDALTEPYANKKSFFIDVLAQGIGMIAAAFYPKPVIVRTSDFKSNEYRNLLGGSYFEPIEANPMLGLRGASRYYSPLYAPAFALECAAMKKVRDEMGFTNVKIMIPFVRTIDEAKKVEKLMGKQGLLRGTHDLELYMMAEIPSNVLLVDEFSQFFDGFSIGSNDLTQTTLAVDRDSALLAPLFDERDMAVKKMLAMMVEGAKKNGIPVGICGQAPSDYPDLADYLIKLGITSLSLNPDAVIPFLSR